MRSVSAIARSSPKFGSVTMMPSMDRDSARNRSAHRFGFVAGLDRAVLRFLGSGSHYAMAGFLSEPRSSLRGRSWPGGPGKIPDCRR